MRRSMLIGAAAGFLTLLVAAGSADAQRLLGGDRGGDRPWRSGPTYYSAEGYSPDAGTGWYTGGSPEATPNYRFPNIRHPFRGYSNRGPSNYFYPGEPGAQPVSAMNSTTTASTGDSQSEVRQSFYRKPELDSKIAELRVIVPTEGARVWIDKGPTKQMGIERVFVSPPLEPGNNYTYLVRATWIENGREMVTEKKVPVKPGFAAVVYFGTQQPVEELSRQRRFFR